MIIFAKFLGFGADQVQVNSRKESSMKALLQQKEKWSTFGWCVSQSQTGSETCILSHSFSRCLWNFVTTSLSL